MNTANIFRQQPAVNNAVRNHQSDWQKQMIQSKQNEDRMWRQRDLPGLQHETLGHHQYSSLDDREKQREAFQQALVRPPVPQASNGGDEKGRRLQVYEAKRKRFLERQRRMKQGQTAIRPQQRQQLVQNPSLRQTQQRVPQINTAPDSQFNRAPPLSPAAMASEQAAQQAQQEMRRLQAEAEADRIRRQRIREEQLRAEKELEMLAKQRRQQQAQQEQEHQRKRQQQQQRMDAENARVREEANQMQQLRSREEQQRALKYQAQQNYGEELKRQMKEQAEQRNADAKQRNQNIGGRTSILSSMGNNNRRNIVDKERYAQELKMQMLADQNRRRQTKRVNPNINGSDHLRNQGMGLPGSQRDNESQRLQKFRRQQEYASQLNAQRNARQQEQQRTATRERASTGWGPTSGRSQSREAMRKRNRQMEYKAALDVQRAAEKQMKDQMKRQGRRVTRDPGENPILGMQRQYAGVNLVNEHRNDIQHSITAANNASVVSSIGNGATDQSIQMMRREIESLKRELREQHTKQAEQQQELERQKDAIIRQSQNLTMIKNTSAATTTNYAPHNPPMQQAVHNERHTFGNPSQAPVQHHHQQMKMEDYHSPTTGALTSFGMDADRRAKQKYSRQQAFNRDLQKQIALKKQRKELEKQKVLEADRKLQREISELQGRSKKNDNSRQQISHTIPSPVENAPTSFNSHEIPDQVTHEQRQQQKARQWQTANAQGTASTLNTDGMEYRRRNNASNVNNNGESEQEDKEEKKRKQARYMADLRRQREEKLNRKRLAEEKEKEEEMKIERRVKREQEELKRKYEEEVRKDEESKRKLKEEQQRQIEEKRRQKEEKLRKEKMEDEREARRLARERMELEKEAAVGEKSVPIHTDRVEQDTMPPPPQKVDSPQKVFRQETQPPPQDRRQDAFTQQNQQQQFLQQQQQQQRNFELQRMAVEREMTAPLQARLSEIQEQQRMNQDVFQRHVAQIFEKIESLSSKIEEHEEQRRLDTSVLHERMSPTRVGELDEIDQPVNFLPEQYISSPKHDVKARISPIQMRPNVDQQQQSLEQNKDSLDILGKSLQGKSRFMFPTGASFQQTSLQTISERQSQVVASPNLKPVDVRETAGDYAVTLATQQMKESLDLPEPSLDDSTLGVSIDELRRRNKERLLKLNALDQDSLDELNELTLKNMQEVNSQQLEDFLQGYLSGNKKASKTNSFAEMENQGSRWLKY
eukprot:g53.t1